MSIITKYYLLIIFIYFLTFSVFVKGLVVDGILYYIFMILLNIFNAYFIIKKNKYLKFKSGLYIFFLLNIIFCKNIFYVILLLSTFVLLTVLNFKDNKVIKVLSVICSTTIILYIQVILFVILLTVFNGNEIYKDSHYYCNNNYEIYYYSGGAMDSFHYSVVKRYKIIEFNNIIKIVYNKNIGNSLDEYNNVLENMECRLVGGK